MTEKPQSRRKFLKYAGEGIIAGAAASAGYYGMTQYPTPTQTPPTVTTSTSTSGGKKLKVRIGGTKPLTGTVALNGIDEHRGLEIWAKRWVNDQGGIKAGDGNTYEIDLIIYNDESKPENVSRLYEKLINEDKVDFLMGPVWAALGQATVATVEKYRKLEIYGNATFDPAQWKDWKYVMMVQTNGSEYLNILNEMIINKVIPQDPDAKNMAIVHTDDAFGNIAGGWGYQWAKKQPQLNIVYYDKVSFGAQDFTPVLTKVKEANPSILLFEAGAQAPLAAKGVRELGLDLKLFYPGTYGVYKQFYDGLGPKYGEDVVSITQWVVGENYQANYGPNEDWFVSTYKRDYNAVPGYPAGTGFTQGLILQAAMEKCKKPLDSDAMRETVGSVSFTGFYGDVAFDPVTGWQTGHKMSALQWQDGKAVCVYPEKVAKAPLRYPMKKWSTIK
ncbi:MAG: amino acid ABC transporter substrate-binding protein [Candidatus Bathyarchaeota archaeon]|nr:amino acid ABC transporter substrate-binding protein [Candidatus Bathyarchaeota archaeon]